MKIHALLCGLGGRLALFPTPALAALATIIPQRDTAIFAESPDNNLGAGNLIAGTNAFGGDNARSLLSFNIAASIPAGSVINSVLFQVGVIRQSNRNTESSYELHRMLKGWTEGNGGVSVNTGTPALAGETTWNSQFHGSTLWGTPGGLAGTDYITLASGTGPVINDASSIYEIGPTSTLTTDVQGWLNNPLNNNGWMFIGSSEGTSGTARRFSSTEVPGIGIASALSPQIIVDYTVAAVPEPTTAGVGMGLALVGAACRRRTVPA
jgi:hypothetical protein